MILLASTTVVRKSSRAPELTTLLCLLFVGDSLKVIVRQFRSVTQTQGNGQRPNEAIRRIWAAVPNLRLRWRERHWSGPSRSWLTVLCQRLGRSASPAGVQGSARRIWQITTHEAAGRHGDDSKKEIRSGYLPFCNSRKQPFQLAPLSSSSACLFKETQSWQISKFKRRLQRFTKRSPLTTAVSSGTSISRWVRNTSSTGSLLSPVNAI